MIAFLKFSALRMMRRSVAALLLRRAAGGDQRLGGGFDRRRRPGDFDAHRIVQERVGEPGDFRRHRRREEQRLAGERHQLADALDVGNEAHVEHAVGFVDDENLDAGQEKAAALGEVEQAAGRGDDHVGAAGDLGLLIAERDAADQEREVQLVIDAVFGEGLLDLGGELARRLENEGSGHSGAGAAALQHGQHRQGEGGGLAGARLGDAEHVAALQGVGNGLRLDGRRRVVTRRFDGFEHLFAQAEFAKFHSISHPRRLCASASGYGGFGDPALFSGAVASGIAPCVGAKHTANARRSLSSLSAR